MESGNGRSLHVPLILCDSRCRVEGYNGSASGLIRNGDERTGGAAQGVTAKFET